MRIHEQRTKTHCFGSQNNNYDKFSNKWRSSIISRGNDSTQSLNYWELWANAAKWRFIDSVEIDVKEERRKRVRTLHISLKLLLSFYYLYAKRNALVPTFFLSFFLSFSLSLCLAQSDGIVMINFSGYLTCADLYFDIFAMVLCFSLGGFNFWFFIHVVCFCNWVKKNNRTR